MTTTAAKIIAALDDEARETLRTVIDLDAFLALDGEQRAARWRQFDRSAKWQLVAQMIERRLGDWQAEEVETWIVRYDAKWGSEPMGSERAVCAALERLAGENAETARRARETGERDDARFFQRAANAYVKALARYRSGIRPEPTERGGWLLPSQRPGEPPHLLKRDGDWVCSCPSSEQIHWASALIIGIEIAGEALDAYDDPTEIAPAPEPQPNLSVRLVAARAKYAEAA